MGDDLLFRAEDLRAEVVYPRDYRGPGPAGKRLSGSATVAVTRRRLVVWVLGGKHVDLPVDQPWSVGVSIRVDRPGLVVLAYDAGAFHPDRSGLVELRLWTDRADELVALAARPVDPVWGELVADGIEYLERGCAATLVRGGDPRRVTVDVAVSRGRFVLWVGGGKSIDLPRVAGRPDGVAARLVEPDGVQLRLRALPTEPGVDPSIMVTIRTSNAVELAELLVGG